MTEETSTSQETPIERAFSWPDRRRAERAERRAARVAQEGLERLQAKPATLADTSELAAVPEEVDEDREAIIEEIAAEVSRRLRLETTDAIALLQDQREGLAEVLHELRELIATAREGLLAEPEEPLPPADVEENGQPAAVGTVDLNTGTLADLRALGMSETQATRVIRHRDHWGQFESVDELDHVAGFTPEHREELKHHLVVASQPE